MEKLINKAQQLGFGVDHQKNKEDYITLCLIQNWLRTRGVDVDVLNFRREGDKYYRHFIDGDIMGLKIHKKHENALKNGIIEGLKRL